jgi:hypothetical protein
MAYQLTSEVVWKELAGELFAVLGMVNAQGEARSAGIVYIVHGSKLYIATEKDSWKARHTRANPNVSLTVPIPKRVPFMPWIKIPAATITFSGTARVYNPGNVSQDILHALLRGLEEDQEKLAETCVIEVEPKGDFVTYGVGVSLMEMRDSTLARGRAPIMGEN